MKLERLDYDAVIVGASLAGCSSAILLARDGARVALVDKRPEHTAFKRVCGHFIQSSAVPSLERIGLLEPMEKAGAVRSQIRMWTRWGWIVAPPDTKVPACVNLRREVLDPLARDLAASTPGVEMMLGQTVDELLHDGDRFAGVAVRDRAGNRTRITAGFVVGADGRDSKIAELAKSPAKVSAHGRFSYGAYFEGPGPDKAPDGSIWMLDPHWAAAFPTDSGLTLYACMPTHARLPEFKQDLDGALRRFMAELPQPPPMAESKQVSAVIGKVKMPNVYRSPSAPGLALVGDAALATDPLFGVGCGWAFQSADWLAESVTPALRGEQPLDDALATYRRRHRSELAAHAHMIHDYATGRPFNVAERILFSAAARDEEMAERFMMFGTRNAKPTGFLKSGFPRALRVHAARAVRPRLRSARSQRRGLPQTAEGPRP
ncbi:MAG: NAD(P)/FAD-dependent oxidoreductase [Thermoleophilaceae bacterium]